MKNFKHKELSNTKFEKSRSILVIYDFDGYQNSEGVWKCILWCPLIVIGDV